MIVIGDLLIERCRLMFQVALKNCPNCTDQQLDPIRYGPYGAVTHTPNLPEDVLFVTMGGETITKDMPLWKCRKCLGAFGRLGNQEEVSEYKEYCRKLQDAGVAEDFLTELLRQAAAEGSREIRWEPPPWVHFIIAGEPILMEPFPRLNEKSIFRFLGSHQDPCGVVIDGAAFEFQIRFYRLNDTECLAIDIGKVDGMPTNFPMRARYPRCRSCQQPLRSPKAKQCFECGMDWH